MYSRQPSGPVADDASVLLQDCDGHFAAAVKSLEDVFGLVLVPVQRVHQIAQLGEERVRTSAESFVCLSGPSAQICSSAVKQRKLS